VSRLRVLVIDNYDSFVFNLVQYLGQLGVDCDVRRNDEISVDEVGAANPAGILLSPGPGTPERAGICMSGAAFGATVTRAPELLHGKTSLVRHDGQGVLKGLPDPFIATRYHSLAVVESTLPPQIEVTGRTDSGVIMAMRHRELPIEGVQFHPESVLTQGGHLMLANWLAVCGLTAALDRAPELAAEVEARRVAAFA
jgi:para-aminobenzoate synthetase component 2